MIGSTVIVLLVWSHGLMIVPQQQQRFRLSRSATVFLTARELFLGVAETIVASHADVLRGSSRVPAPRTEYEGLWVCSKRGLDKLRASEQCESPVKKKGNTSKNCKFTDEELSTHYTD